jgi:hypothetical protein
MTLQQLRARLSASEDTCLRPDYSDLIGLLDDAELDDELRALIEDADFVDTLVAR